MDCSCWCVHRPRFIGQYRFGSSRNRAKRDCGSSMINVDNSILDYNRTELMHGSVALTRCHRLKLWLSFNFILTVDCAFARFSLKHLLKYRKLIVYKAVTTMYRANAVTYLRDGQRCLLSTFIGTTGKSECKWKSGYEDAFRNVVKIWYRQFLGHLLYEIIS